MHFVIIGGLVLGAYLLTKMKPAPLQTAGAPASSVASAPAPVPIGTVPAPVQSSAVATLQTELAGIENQLGALAGAPTLAPTVKKTVPHMTPQQAITAALQTEGSDIDPRDAASFLNTTHQGWIDSILRGAPIWITPQQALQAGLPPSWYPTPAGYQGASSLGLVRTSSGLALQGAGIGAGLAGAVGVSQAIPFIGQAIGAIVGIFSIFTAHHAAAVKQEQSIFYTVNPAAYDYLAAIRKAVSIQQASAGEAIQAIKSLQADYEQQAAPSVKHNPCNANCEGVVWLRAVTIYWESYYQDMMTQGATQ